MKKKNIAINRNQVLNHSQIIVAIKDVIVYDGFVEQITGEVLFNPSGYTQEQNKWIWQNLNDGSCLFYEDGQDVQFKIMAVNMMHLKEDQEQTHQIIGCMNEQGLGPNLWWDWK
ncbi:hypothetical protein IMG5_076340 [Ichthyophthirius multifiliis]|uniref:RNA polymerase III subunit Rpc25 domain-containing protein n=1 Tax=Ichthyophthirius multifiliis TaxID=5932 RepID=G0QQA3_ICHMU|nr:hypothetical protein IMG5_076340 [Ichthyophthirius multifiliis]EGR32604.1 hypothetical protein IMG5_076340 [Ichthyophthirius multifiliis]|eukprot:XP_004036590.1 hypothetical protein IMG5_076340 [Ichthyophthirius multifiliis]